MQITPKTKKEAENLISHIFLQGDMRHFDSFYLELIANFILNKAIDIEKEVFSFEDKKENLKIYGPQKIEKSNALQILQLKNLSFEGFEMPFLNYKVDILAKKEDKYILVECGPCRLWKALYYLEEDAELWITRDEEKTELFIIKRGENWDSQLKEFNNNKAELLKRIKSPYDSMMEEKEKNKI
jgi:hypothetical protein